MVSNNVVMGWLSVKEEDIYLFSCEKLEVRQHSLSTNGCLESASLFISEDSCRVCADR